MSVLHKVEQSYLNNETTKALTVGVKIFIKQFWAWCSWPVGIFESWLSVSSSEVKASSISEFLSRDVSSPAVGDIYRSGRYRCVRCRGSHPVHSSLWRWRRAVRLAVSGTLFASLMGNSFVAIYKWIIAWLTTLYMRFGQLEGHCAVKW